MKTEKKKGNKFWKDAAQAESGDSKAPKRKFRGAPGITMPPLVKRDSVKNGKI